MGYTAAAGGTNPDLPRHQALPGTTCPQTKREEQLAGPLEAALRPAATEKPHGPLASVQESGVKQELPGEETLGRCICLTWTGVWTACLTWTACPGGYLCAWVTMSGNRKHLLQFSTCLAGCSGDPVEVCPSPATGVASRSDRCGSCRRCCFGGPMSCTAPLALPPQDVGTAWDTLGLDVARGLEAIRTIRSPPHPEEEFGGAGHTVGRNKLACSGAGCVGGWTPLFLEISQRPTGCCRTHSARLVVKPYKSHIS